MDPDIRDPEIKVVGAIDPLTFSFTDLDIENVKMNEKTGFIEIRII